MIIYPAYKYKSFTPEHISKFLQKEYHYLRFNTREGVIEILNDKIYKLVDLPNMELYQFSKELSFNLQHNPQIKKEIYYIPIDYTYKKYNVKKYKLLSNSILTLIVENNDEFYFETNENEITESIKEDMITFLSMLKLYN